MLPPGVVVTFVPLGATRVIVGAWLVALTFQSNPLVKLNRSFATAVMVVVPVLKLRLQESLPADPETGVEWSNTPFTYQSTSLRLPSESAQFTWKVMLPPGVTVTFVPLGATRVMVGAWLVTLTFQTNALVKLARSTTTAMIVVVPVLKLVLQEALPEDPVTVVGWSYTPFTYQSTSLRLPAASEQFTWKVVLWLGATVTFVPLGATRVMVGPWLLTLTFQCNALVKLVRSFAAAVMVVVPVLKLRLQESLPADPETGVEWSNTPFTYQSTSLRLPSESAQFTWKVMLWLGAAVTFVPLGLTRVIDGAAASAATVRQAHNTVTRQATRFGRPRTRHDRLLILSEQRKHSAAHIQIDNEQVSGLVVLIFRCLVEKSRHGKCCAATQAAAGDAS